MLPRSLTLLCFLFINLHLCAQDDKVTETDSSVITTKYSEYDNLITIFNDLKHRHKTYFTELYFDSKKIREKGVFENGSSVGVWKLYSPEGKLIRAINYDKGEITYHDKKLFPHYTCSQIFKLKADSIIKSVYGEKFFDQHIVWDVDGSSVYGYSWAESMDDWLDAQSQKPVKFIFSYKIKFDNQQYFDMLNFTIDNNGLFVMNRDIIGFEKLSPILKSPDFVATGKGFIDMARKKGLVENAPAKASVTLTWQEDNSISMYRGRFLIYVSIKTRSIKNLNPKGRSSVVDKYDVYVFNPWTGNFIEKKKMETWRGWERNSGSSIGLMPSGTN